MTTKKVFSFYIIFSVIAAWYYIFGNGEETLFRYGTLVDQSSLFSATLFLLAGLMAFLLGSYAAMPVFKTVEDPRLFKRDGTVSSRRRTRPPLWQSFGVAGIAIIYIYLFFASVIENGLPENLAERVFENKLSAFFMMALAYFGYSASLHKNTVVSRAVILTISLSVVVIDGSRSGLIPLFGLVMGALVRKRFLSTLFLAYLVFFGASYSITARFLEDRLGFNVLYAYFFPDLELAAEAVRFIFDYAFAFSILHFSYMSFVAMPEFTWSQLVTSLNPLPSYFLDPDVIDSLKFEDRVRAIGGPAELLIVGPAVFCVGFFVFGVLAAYADTVVKSRYRFIVLLMFLIATIVFFQYNLRTSARMLTAIVLVIFLLRRAIKATSGGGFSSSTRRTFVVNADEKVT